jgi:hypothetical protein
MQFNPMLRIIVSSAHCPCCSGDHAMRWLLLTALLNLAGCGLIALPFRAAGDVIEIVPVIGKPIGAPIHAVGDVID